MKIVVEMPWERDLSVNTYRFGRPAPGQKFRRRKPHVQAWMERLAYELTFRLARSIDIPLFKLHTAIKVDFRWPDKRERDDDNYYKVIKDAVRRGLGLKSDKDIRISTRSVTVDRENPGFTIEVSDE